MTREDWRNYKGIWKDKAKRKSKPYHFNWDIYEDVMTGDLKKRNSRGTRMDFKRMIIKDDLENHVWNENPKYHSNPWD